MATAEQYTYSIEGMHCAKCIRKIQQLTKDFAAVSDLRINFDNATIQLKAKDSFDSESYAKAVAAKGFGVRLLSTVESQPESNEQTWFLARIAVAGACAGNIMLLAISTYSATDSFEFKSLFAWISFFLFLPVIFFSAWPILTNALQSIWQKRLSVDTPLALAIFGSFLLSTYNLVTNKDQIYFDSLAMFVFFLMASRYLIFRIQRKYLSPVSLKDLFQNQKIKTSTGQSVAASEIQKDDEFSLDIGGSLPIDSVLLSDFCEVDNSIITGESNPHTYKKYDRLITGAKVLSKNSNFRALSTQKESETYQLIDKINTLLSQDTKSTRLVDRGAYYLTLLILLAAGTTLAYFSFYNLQEGFERVLALLVVACPCGLAIATPLAHSLSVKKALKKSILVKDINALEQLNACDIFIFDKTGTLTTGDLSIQNWQPIELSKFEKQLLYSIEKDSEHPIAKAVLRDIGEQDELHNINHKEIIGSGIEAIHNKDKYFVKTQSSENKNSICIYKNGQILKSAELIDKISTNAECTIKDIQSLGKDIVLLSGDNIENSKVVGQRLGLSTENIIAGVNPQEKLQYVEDLLKKRKKVAYFGDGVNDAAAMADANVSVSMHSSASLAFKASQVHFLGQGLTALKDFFEISKNCVLAIKGNILLSFIYNSIFAGLAIAGFITPLLAVVLMPLSSLATVFWSFWAIQRKVAQ